MEAACSGAKSIAQVCRNLGLKPAGGNYETVKNNLEKFGIEIILKSIIYMRILN